MNAQASHADDLPAAVRCQAPGAQVEYTACLSELHHAAHVLRTEDDALMSECRDFTLSTRHAVGLPLDDLDAGARRLVARERAHVKAGETAQGLFTRIDLWRNALSQMQSLVRHDRTGRDEIEAAVQWVHRISAQWPRLDRLRHRIDAVTWHSHAFPLTELRGGICRDWGMEPDARDGDERDAISRRDVLKAIVARQQRNGRQEHWLREQVAFFTPHAEHPDVGPLLKHMNTLLTHFPDENDRLAGFLAHLTDTHHPEWH